MGHSAGVRIRISGASHSRLRCNLTFAFIRLHLTTSGIKDLEHVLVKFRQDDDFVLTSKKMRVSRILRRALDFQIPPQTLRAALAASPNSAGSFWKHSMYKSSTGKSVTMHYCRRRVDAENVAQHFMNDPVVGFDMEWEKGSRLDASNVKRSVSLVQLANENRIGLFHIALFDENTAETLMPPTLRQILESSNIVKAGVNIGGDFTRLRKCLDIDGRGIFELSHLYTVVKHSDNQRHLINRKSIQLATQVQDILHLPLKKDAIRISAWSKRLDMEQCDYAATDAYAGFRLYHALEDARKKMDPMPQRPALYELAQPLILGDGTEATK